VALRLTFARRTALGAACLVIPAVMPAAAMAWTAQGGGQASVTGGSMPAATAPISVTASNHSVTVSWNQITLQGAMLGGQTGGGYEVVRLPAAGGAAQTPNSSCGSIVSGAAAVLTCADSSVPSGSWRYAIIPRWQTWQGAQSASSATVTIGSASLSFSSSTTITTLPATLTGTVTSFFDAETIGFRLDSPTGTTLTGSVAGAPTPASVPSGGSATITVTVPAGTHTIYAVGSNGSTATAAITVNIAPQATGLTIANQSTLPGTPQQTDTLTISFSQKLAVTSVCSTWSGNDTTQTLTGVTATIATASGNATRLTASVPSTSCGGTLHLGTLTMSRGFLPNGSPPPATFTNTTITWNPTTKTLVLTLGTLTAGTPTSGGTTATATYPPDATLQGTTGLPVLTTPISATVTLF